MRDNEKGIPVAEQGALWNKQVKMILVAPEIRLCHSFQEHWAQLADWPAHLYKVLISYAPSFLELDWLSSKPWESFVFPLLELGLQTLTIIPGFLPGHRQCESAPHAGVVSTTPTEPPHQPGLLVPPHSNPVTTIKALQVLKSTV